jgi:hypothetical protein
MTIIAPGFVVAGGLPLVVTITAGDCENPKKADSNRHAVSKKIFII